MGGMNEHGRLPGEGGDWNGGKKVKKRRRPSVPRKKREPVKATPKPGRNETCPECNSGMKWKHCHGRGGPSPRELPASHM